MPWMEVLDNDIYYVDAGSGPPMVFLHGMSSCSEAWWQQLEHFSARYRVIAYDSVNHGHSSNSEPAFRTVQPIDDQTLFLPIGDSLTDRLKQERPRMYERYLRIRSTATRLEYMRHPRERNPKTIEETAAIADTITAVTSPMLVVVGTLDRLVPAARRLHDLVPHSEYVEIQGSPHNVYYETAREWNQAVDAFVNGLPAH